MDKAVSGAGRWLHRLFETGLVANGVLAGLEALAGVGLIVTTNRTLHGLADWLVRQELAQDPSDRMALWFQRATEGFSAGSQHFYAVYSASHGFLKLALVAGLVLRLRLAYPAAIVILAGFVVYQMLEWRLTGSPMLLALSVFDLAMIALTWREFRQLPPNARP